MDLRNNSEFMKNLDNDVEALSKSLYLENPDLWLDFLEKSSDKDFDEMALFFAAKHDFISIIRYSVEVNKFNLDSVSKNKSFSSIRNHLIDVANTEGSSNVLRYLAGKEDLNDLKETSKDSDIEFEIKEILSENYLGPIYNCPHCNLNIFESGYNILISSKCTYSVSHRKLIRSSPNQLDIVVCSNCKNEISDITPSKLEDIINIENCKNCNIHLPTSGILKEVNVKFNKDNDTFEDDKSTYCCKSCRKPLEDIQLQHFNLI